MFLLFTIVNSGNLLADNHEEEQNIIDQAKEINKEVKKKQAETQANINSEIGQEEPLPLNDPFVGDASLGGATTISTSVSAGEERSEMSLYNFKLVGLISGKDHSYISLVNSGGEVVTLGLGQFLGKIKLIDLRLTEAIFKKEDETYIILDFNNQIRETNEY